MRGDLGSSSVVDLCRGLAEASSTGTVELSSSDGSGNIIFRRGRVVWAQSPAPRARLGDRLVNAALLTQEELDQALEAQAQSDEPTKLGALLVEQGLVTRDVIRVFVQEQILDAVFDLMRWRDGEFEFTPETAMDEKLPVDIPVDQVLVEVSRRQSEWDQIERAIPDLDMVPDFATGGSSAAASLEPDEFAVLASVDGRRSIRDLASHLGYSEFEAARIVYGLTLLGVVSVGGDEDEPTESDEVEAEFDLAGEREDVGPDLGTTKDDDVDIGQALEDALTSQRDDEPRERPEVRVHVDDEGRFRAPARDSGRGEPEPDAVADEPGAEAVADEPQPEAIAGAPEPEPVSDEPEPWTPDEADLAYFGNTVEEESRDEPAEDAAQEPAPARDLRDEDFETLINQLAGAPETGPGEAAPPEAEAPSPPRDEAPTPPRPDEPVDAPSEEHREPEGERAGSDVSEFLRELSRLAVDDEEAGPEPPSRARPKPAEPRDDDERPPARSEEQKQDDKKKKGFFGWGR